MATSLVTLLPPSGRTPVWNGEPSRKSARSIVPGADVGHGHARGPSRCRTGRPRPRPAGAATKLVDLARPAWCTHLVRFCTAVAGGVDDVGLDLQADRAHADRVVDALLAVDDEGPRQDVQDLPVGRDVDRPGDLHRPHDVVVADLLAWPADGDRPVRVLASRPRGPRRSTQAPRSCSPTVRSACSMAGRDRADGLLDVDDDALLEARRRRRALAQDVQPAVGRALTDEHDDLARADVDGDQHRFSFHRLAVLF